MIKLNNIHVLFNPNTHLENHVLKGITLNIHQGDFITVIGGNGAGKSTLLNILAGETLPSQGQIYIHNQDVTKLNSVKRAAIVSRVFQDPLQGTFAELTIEENLALACKRGRKRWFRASIHNTLRKKMLTALMDLDIGLEDRLNDKVSNLSGGQRQALNLIMATIQDTKILLLDEHTAALDPKMANRIMILTKQIIEKYQLTALMITHSMQQALEFGTRTIMLHNGQIVKDMNHSERMTLQPQDLFNYFV